MTTIAALATANSPAGVAIVRLSGTASLQIAQEVFSSKKPLNDNPRLLVFGTLRDPLNGFIIDHCLAAYMPGPHSYTGEDIVEFHTHGSPVICKLLLRTLFNVGATPAEPGEFTRRAFLNGKVDLAQAEAVSTLINSSSELGLKRANEQLAGRLSAAIAEIGEPIRDSLAEVEAALDFPEEDIETERSSEICVRIANGIERISTLINSYEIGHKIRDGLRVLLCGEPNVGKSSLMNAILGKERAIVTPISGTTRDVIEEELLLHGYKVVLCDSAGITDTTDIVEAKGIQLTKERIEWADLILCVVSATDSVERWNKIMEELQSAREKSWLVINKSDLSDSSDIESEALSLPIRIRISAKTGAGIDALKDQVRSLLDSLNSTEISSGVVITEERHRNALQQAKARLSLAIDNLSCGLPYELSAADIRDGLRMLDEIIGRTYTEDILGRIFGKFCIGK